MSIVRRALAMTAAVAGLMVSSAALANPAASLSVVGAARASAPAGKSKIGAGVGGSTLINIAILAAITVVLLTVVDTGSGNDSPDSR